MVGSLWAAVVGCGTMWFSFECGRAEVSAMQQMCGARCRRGLLFELQFRVNILPGDGGGGGSSSSSSTVEVLCGATAARSQTSEG
jgi:hypothetical protein